MEKYKLLLFTDYHITSKGRRTIKRLGECVRTAKWLAKLIKDTWPDLVANLGDTFNDHSSLDVPSLCTGVRVIDIISRACKARGAEFIVIPGNHDAYSEDYSSLEAIKGATIVWEPSTFDGIVGALPFTKDYKKATQWIQELEKKVPIVLAHTDVQDAGPFFRSDIGVRSTDFRGPIYAGHYHHPHSVGSFEFVGSVLHHNFSDEELEDVPRGALMLHIRKKDGKILKSERFGNPHSAIYHKANWLTNKGRPDTIRRYGKYGERMHLRIKCASTDAKKIREEVEEVFPDLLSYRIIGINKDVEVVEREVSIKVDTDPKEAVTAYVKNKGASGLDEELLLSYGLELVSLL